MVSHQSGLALGGEGGLSSGGVGGLSSGWSLIRAVSSGW